MRTALLAIVFLVPLAAADPNQAANQVGTRELHPFTHVASVSDRADPGTIRLKNIKLVKVPTRILYTFDSAYCDELQFRDPGGSAFCPESRNEAFETAYELTYSLKSQPMASDEYASSDFTFSVYFRPGELPADLQKAIANKLSRTDLAGYFAVKTSPEMASRMAIDNEKSRFCEGNYVDGAWTHTDRDCQDDIRYVEVASSSGFITVKVEPVSKSANLAAVGGK